MTEGGPSKKSKAGSPPPRDPVGPDAPVDMARLRQIAGDDPSFVRSLTDLFLASTQHNLYRLEAAIGEENIDLLRHTAHTIKGASGNAGAWKMERIASAIEKEAAEGRAGPASTFLADLKEEFIRVRSFLAEEA